MTLKLVPYRRLFGFDPDDLALGPLVNWNGIRIDESDAPSGNNARSYSLNPSVVTHEMAARARRRYGHLDLSPDVSPEERQYGIPEGTHFHLSAQASRREIAARDGAS